jgi:hypothetical protein
MATATLVVNAAILRMQERPQGRLNDGIAGPLGRGDRHAGRITRTTLFGSPFAGDWVTAQ